MKIVSFSQPVLINSGVVKPDAPPPFVYGMNPGERCLISDDMTSNIMSAKDNRIESISDFGPFYAQNVKRPLNFRDKRVLFYRNRGIGDQLAASCLSRFFTEKLKAKCFQLSDRIYENLWYGNPYTSGMPVRFPVNMDALIRWKGRPFYDYCFFMESVGEWCVEQEQQNFYDIMFSLAGLEPANVPADFKRPVWGMIPEDEEVLKAWKDQYGVIDDNYIVVQLGATNLGRNPPVKSYDVVLERLNDIGVPVLCLDDKKLSEEMIEVGKKYPNAKNLARTVNSIRLYGSIVVNAKMVVGPDSSAIHFAASRGVPCIGLWGPFSPESRAKYYPNHYPIYKQDLCVNSPCFNFMPILPAHKCPRGALQEHCEVFEGVTREEVDKVVSEVIKNHKILC